ncbi:protein-L-isoaspartate(D-aspartate) O-methyltransferase [Paucibacter sp. PLA-PC-4]|uniref:protein-L-isoaspartate O-methyltransferase family protein n=1 Tax=Paucibacter sp. PLA-PC-4 TaxID=2993655 RepID=UPI002248BC03|nr:protein-L-isoaspartate(D-aspartate) O-methyltransferase [Paucibacter sp. PLA-PC-4]MCX2862910.1 protein-L-isoaspartate(D-aspartate) O-methyltransferase [Paucibacter sp. PLA-PC-4]
MPTEDYLGPGPWPVFIGSGYLPTISNDPGLLYQDVLIGLAPERGISNGQPSLHARCLAAPASGETVLHIGAGTDTGYYTAVLANLVGPDGSVPAYEIEADLAARARQNLSWAGERVEVVAASASAGPLPASDVIYVNAGATHPLAAWLDALKIGGRLIIPLTPDTGMGCMLRVTRLGERSYAATALMRVAFIPCIGARPGRLAVAGGGAGAAVAGRGALAAARQQT